MPQLHTFIIFFLALLPALVWMMIFFRKHRMNPWPVFFTFIGGILAAQLILLYKGYWDTTLNLIFFEVRLVDFRSNISALIVNTALAAFVVFLGIGAMEEFFKFTLMRLINKSFFHSIDDVITLSIVSALGFSFYENVVYFNAQWGQLSTNSFIFLVISRVTIVTMVHMLCSGVLGYYFGLAHFASPVLRLEYVQKKQHPFLIFFKNILHIKKTHLYKDEMMAIGLVSAMLLHSLYDLILSSTFALSNTFVSVAIMTYFLGGYLLLTYLLKRKEARMKLGLLTHNRMEDEQG